MIKNDLQLKYAVLNTRYEDEIKSSILKFEKPIPKGEVKLVPADDIDQLIDLLHNEANVI